jgi:anti-anti-sigma factor
VSVRRSELSENLWVIEARGRLDASGAPDLQLQLEGLLEHGQSALAVDFSRVSYISSSGLKALLIALRRARRMGGDVKLFGMRDRVREVFDLAGFDGVFQIVPHEADAVAAYADQPSEVPRRE